MNKSELPSTNKTYSQNTENYTEQEAKNTKTRNILLWFKIQYTLHIKQNCDTIQNCYIQIWNQHIRINFKGLFIFRSP